MSNAIRIGFPRALFYYYFFPLWRTFFEELGCKIVVSGKTTKAVLDAGVKETVTDACVPIKIFHGHVMALSGKVDYVFVPRLVNQKRNFTFCPKFLGLPDMVRYSMEGIPDIIDVRLDYRKGRNARWKAFFEVGSKFTSDKKKIKAAFKKAHEEQAKYEALLLRGYLPAEALRLLRSNNDLVLEETNDEADIPVLSDDAGANPSNPSKLRMAVLGYPYAINDSYINLNLVDKLRKMDVQVLTAEMILPKVLDEVDYEERKEIFWHFSDQALRAAYYFLKNPHLVDGIIHITAFGCGPDFMVDKIMDLAAKKYRSVPFLSVTIDEQTGEGGIATRLEAFVDMIKRRKYAASQSESQSRPQSQSQSQPPQSLVARTG